MKQLKGKIQIDVYDRNMRQVAHNKELPYDYLRDGLRNWLRDNYQNNWHTVICHSNDDNNTFAILNPNL